VKTVLQPYQPIPIPSNYGSQQRNIILTMILTVADTAQRPYHLTHTTKDHNQHKIIDTLTRGNLLELIARILIMQLQSPYPITNLLRRVLQQAELINTLRDHLCSIPHQAINTHNPLHINLSHLLNHHTQSLAHLADHIQKRPIQELIDDLLPLRHPNPRMRRFLPVKTLQGLRDILLAPFTLRPKLHPHQRQ
jgi:hypothetical protein